MSDLDIEVAKGPVDSVFQQSDVLVAASGTVTLEAALHGVPTVIVYKVSPLSYWLGKRLIKVNYIGITNLIVQKELQPELIQDNASPSGIAQKIVSMIHDRDGLRQVETELLRVRDLLGGAGASERVARIALSLC
jgi:lipid-A-disaccharide synthase